MKCDEIRSKLPLHAGDDLPDGERAGVAAHVAACAACRRELDALNCTREHLAGLRERSEYEALDALSRRVAQGVRRRHPASAVAVAAAASLLIGAALAILWGGREGSGAADSMERQRAQSADRTTPEITESQVVGPDILRGVPRNVMETPERAAPLAPDRVVATIYTDNPSIRIIWLASDKEQNHVPSV